MSALIACWLMCTLYARDDLTIELRPARIEIALGDPIALDVSFANIGDVGLFVERSYDLGREHLNILARRDGCEYSVAPIHAITTVDARRFLLTPLAPRDRLIQPVITLNTIESLGGADLFLPAPGEYSLQATFRSDGPAVVNGVSPVWRGTATTPPIILTVRSPDRAMLDRMRSLVQIATRTGVVDPTAVAYFRYVRDNQAADLLALLLSKEPSNPLVIEALAHQGRPSDAELLALHARAHLTGDAKLSAYVGDLVTRLRKREPCDQRKMS